MSSKRADGERDRDRDRDDRDKERRRDRWVGWHVVFVCPSSPEQAKKSNGPVCLLCAFVGFLSGYGICGKDRQQLP